jgi:hypothetical protein
LQARLCSKQLFEQKSFHPSFQLAMGHLFYGPGWTWYRTLKNDIELLRTAGALRADRRKYLRNLRRTAAALFFYPMMLTAQLGREHDVVPLKHWAAPLYWQASQGRANAAQADAAGPSTSTTPLTFVAMTPCRMVDTRTGQGFSGTFGPPSLIGNAPARTFSIESSSTCSIPSLAQAYSFNVTVIPGNSIGFITAYPTGQAQPLAATLVWQPNVVVSNGAIVAAGTSMYTPINLQISSSILTATMHGPVT